MDFYYGALVLMFVVAPFLVRVRRRIHEQRQVDRYLKRLLSDLDD